MTEKTLTFTKVRAGWYATEDGTYAVMHDGYDTKVVDERGDPEGSNYYEGYRGNEWAFVYDAHGRLREDGYGDNMDWFDTMREAKEAANRHAAYARAAAERNA